MKKYISAILIPCFMLQLFGCYSMREISFEELKNYNGAKDIKIKTNQEEIFIKKITHFVENLGQQVILQS